MFSSCLKDDSDYERQVKIDDQIISKYLMDNNIQAQKNSIGFYYKVITPNNSGTTLKQDDVVSFYYTVSLLNGTLLETNDQPDDQPAQFKLLNYAMIPEGLDYGISKMKVGEKYRFFIPSYLAFGSYGCSDFPANSNFIIDVEVADTQSETEINDIQLDSIENYVNANYELFNKYTSGLYFIDSIPGNGNKPFAGDMVTIDFTRKYLNNIVIKTVQETSIYLDHNQAVQGLEEGIKLMKEEGSAILIMPSSLAFKQSLCVIPQKTRKEMLDDKLISAEVLPYSIVKYIVKLKSIN